MRLSPSGPQAFLESFLLGGRSSGCRTKRFEYMLSHHSLGDFGQFLPFLACHFCVSEDSNAEISVSIATLCPTHLPSFRNALGQPKS